METSQASTVQPVDGSNSSRIGSNDIFSPKSLSDLMYQDIRVHRTPLSARVCNKGSLPLKKRRLTGLCEPESPNDATMSDSTQQLLAGRSDEKIAALALVAAAAATNSPVDSESDSMAQHPLCASSFNLPYAPLLYPTKQEMQEQIDDHLPSQMAALTTTSGPKVPLHVVAEKSGTLAPRQRTHHPPLVSPQPNGCHGRTSRNNSYCRRQPCYNGSQYCKLHYQQYVVAANRHTTSNGDSDFVGNANSGSCSSDSQLAPRAPGPAPQPHQDKRYTGLPDEERCQATTTRGRPCAYIAANGTKYCHLHVDYDTNPPPRRGGCGENSTYTKSSKAGALPTGCIVASSSSSDASTGSSRRVDMCLESKKNAVRSLTRAKPPFGIGTLSKEAKSKHPSLATVVSACEERDRAKVEPLAKPSYPLLSSVSSDHWANKLVLISTGPFTNVTGRVTKWGNGWVTVCTLEGNGSGEEGILHNRRAVELYLLPEDSDISKAKETTTDSTSAISSRTTPSEGNRRSRNAAVDSDESARKLDEKENDGAVSNSDGESSEREPMHIANSAPYSRDFPGNSPKVPGAISTRSEGQSSSPSPATQTSPKADERLLQESLSLGKDGRSGRKYNADLLYGTAALERSRRTIQKPKRYEDKAMLEKKRDRHGRPDFGEAEREGILPPQSPVSPGGRNKSSLQ